MITTVTIERFKRFKDPTVFSFKPEGVTFLAGGNNSGKSTLLQALAVWDFARSVIEVGKSKSAFLPGAIGRPISIGAEEFSPLALPNLKHLFSDLQPSTGLAGGSYPLRIKCEWMNADNPPSNRFLEFSFALSNDRLFIKSSTSNLAAADRIPILTYLPPFAGMGPREERIPPAIRKRLIGRGLAGAVLRNLLYDFWERNQIERKTAKGIKKSIPPARLAEIRRSDSWEQLLQVLEEIFKAGLSVKEFNQLLHTSIDIGVWDGNLVGKSFKKIHGKPVRDLMVEGSGFLQWLSVYALALNKEPNVLLLDEPDAHLHPALQGHLLHKLKQLARENQKQVLLATHSTTILSETKVGEIFRMEDRAYLPDEAGRVRLFVGLGSQYAPRLDQLKKTRRLFLHDGPSNIEILQAWARTLKIQWPENLVEWVYKKNTELRKNLFTELCKDINDLKVLSLEDRDDFPFTATKTDLTYSEMPLFKSGLGLRRWRRRNIENYLLHPAAISRVSGRDEAEVRAFLADPHGLNVPADFTISDCVQTLANTDGKEILITSARSISSEFGIHYKQVAEAMLPSEIPDDVKTLLNQIVDLCKP